MTKLAENNPQGTANIADDRMLTHREFKDLVERLELLEKAVKNNTVLPLVGRSFSPGQKIKVELED